MAQERISNQDQSKEILRKTAEKAKDRLRKEAGEHKEELESILASLRNAAVALDTFRNPKSDPDDTTPLQMRREGLLLRQMAYNQAVLEMATELESTPEFRHSSRQEIIAFITGIIDGCLGTKHVTKKVESLVLPSDVVLEARLEPKKILSPLDETTRELPVIPTKKIDGLTVLPPSGIPIRPPVPTVRISVRPEKAGTVARRNPKIGRSTQEQAGMQPEKKPEETLDQAAEALLRELTEDKTRYDTGTVWMKLRENYRAREKEGDRAVQAFIDALHTKLQGGDLPFFQKLNADLEPVKGAGISVLGEDTDDRNWRVTVENGVVTKTRIATLSDIVTRPKDRVTVPITLRLKPDTEIGDDKLEATWLEIHGQLAESFGLPAETERARITAGMPPLVEVTDPVTAQRVDKRREVEIFQSQIQAKQTPSITVTNADFLILRKNALERAGKSYQPFFRNSVEVVRELEKMKNDDFLGFMAAFAASGKDRIADTIGGVNALFGSETAAEMEKTIRASWGSLNIAKEATSETMGAMLGGGIESMMFFVAAGAAGKAIRLPGALARFASVSSVMPKVPLLVVTVLPGANQAYAQAKGSLEQQVRHDPKLASLSAQERRSYVERWARGSAWFGAVIAVSESLLGLGTVTNRVLNGSQGFLTSAISRAASSPALQQRLTVIMGSPAMQRALQGIRSSEQLGRMGTYAGVILNEAGEEGLQEVIEQFLGNLNQRLLADPEADLSEGVLQSMLLGSVFGVAGRYYAEGANGIASRLERNRPNSDENNPPLQIEVPEEEKDDDKNDFGNKPPPPPPPPPLQQPTAQPVAEISEEEKQKRAEAKAKLIADYQAKQEAEKTPEQLDKERQQARAMMAELARRQREARDRDVQQQPPPDSPEPSPLQVPIQDPGAIERQARETFEKGKAVLESAMVRLVDLMQTIENLKLAGMEAVSQRLSVLVIRLRTLLRGWDESLTNWENRSGRRVTGLASDGVTTVMDILAVLGSVPASVRESWNNGAQGRTETWQAMTDRFRGILATMTAWRELLRRAPKHKEPDDQSPEDNTSQQETAPEPGSPRWLEGLIFVREEEHGDGSFWYRDTGGQEWLMKFGREGRPEYSIEAQARVEGLAQGFYRHFGIIVPETHVMRTTAGKVITVVKKIGGAQDLEESNGHTEALTKLLVLDWFLSNRDGFKNILTSEGGQLVSIDQGGSLMVRALGEYKIPDTLDLKGLLVYAGDPATSIAFNIKSSVARMKNKMYGSFNPSTALAFAQKIGQMSDAEIVAMVEEIALMSGQALGSGFDDIVTLQSKLASMPEGEGRIVVNAMIAAGGEKEYLIRLLLQRRDAVRNFDFKNTGKLDAVKLVLEAEQRQIDNQHADIKRQTREGKLEPGSFDKLVWTHRTDGDALLKILQSGHLYAGDPTEMSNRGANLSYGLSSGYGDVQIYYTDDVVFSQKANYTPRPGNGNTVANLVNISDRQAENLDVATETVQFASGPHGNGVNHIDSQPFLFIGENVENRKIQMMVIPEHITLSKDWPEVLRLLKEQKIPFTVLRTGRSFLEYTGSAAILFDRPNNIDRPIENDWYTIRKIREDLEAIYNVQILNKKQYRHFLMHHLQTRGLVKPGEDYEKAYDRIKMESLQNGIVGERSIFENGQWHSYSSADNHFVEQQFYFNWVAATQHQQQTADIQDKIHTLNNEGAQSLRTLEEQHRRRVEQDDLVRLRNGEAIKTTRIALENFNGQGFEIRIPGGGVMELTQERPGRFILQNKNHPNRFAVIEEGRTILHDQGTSKELQSQKFNLQRRSGVTGDMVGNMFGISSRIRMRISFEVKGNKIVMVEEEDGIYGFMVKRN